MAIPEADQPSSWLGGYGDVIADVERMEQFAAQLRAEIIEHYIPHLRHVDDSVMTALPQPCDAFAELVTFLEAHRVAQQATVDLVHFFRDATGGLAVAAEEVSARYTGADAFAAARVHEVVRALDATSAAARPATESAAQSPRGTTTEP